MQRKGTQEGFLHRGLIVYAVVYTTTDRSQIIVWLDRQGHDLNGRTAAENGKAVVTTKPGEWLVNGGKRHQVASVEIYRALRAR